MIAEVMKLCCVERDPADAPIINEGLEGLFGYGWHSTRIGKTLGKR
jgi:hypothetical protein